MSPSLVYELPMRWADLDLMNHVNNVVYLDYAEEARAAHVEAGELEDVRPGSITVEYLRPVLLTRVPVRVTTSRAGDALVQEVGIGDAAEPAARITSEPAATLAPVATTGGAPTTGGVPHVLRVRRTDLDADGFATTSALFEYGQEARVAALERFRTRGEFGAAVVARVDVHLGEPFVWRTESYAARTVVTGVGRSSFTVSTLFDEGERGRADAVLVAFDQPTQRSRALTDAERQALTAL